MGEQEKQQQEQEQNQKQTETWYISGEYLSAAANMVAWQFIDDSEADYPNFEAVHTRMEQIMRIHCPVARKYFFDHYPEGGSLPPGTVDIILDMIWQQRPLFMGGRPGGHATITK